ncbi:MAG: 2Fe-2S iron-sulfur cluster-binding protein [Anaerolineae bacterium]
MADTVKIYIDDQAYDVPKGANLVDAAKQLGNDIPVFCYHPKMKPVGMCRMCLVEMGNVQRDRATNEVMLDDKGNPQIRWMPKLQTACTTTVSDGLVIRTGTKPVADARKNVIEFLLTSHPLDCPICDKGGECPLQNQTLEYGPGVSRMVFDDKMHLDKHVPLGDLIFLDEERCIQCARCVRFQDEIVGDPVLGFHERGRSLQIVTMSDPGFDTYFSGNTTDICPVGALTTEDFRFGARPWELTNVPSICPHCPVGCNITLSTRLDRDFDGRAMIKRVMPRQNEQVNEIWICDKGRFGHHFTRSDERLMQPLVNGAPASWADALSGRRCAQGGGEVAAITGSQMSNEDLWALRKLVGEGRKGRMAPTHGGIQAAGAGRRRRGHEPERSQERRRRAGDRQRSRRRSPRLAAAHQERADRGAFVVVANSRHTRMDDFASATIRYEAGQAAAALGDAANADIVGKLTGAADLVVVAGAEGLTFDGSRALMQAAANLLISSGHVSKPNNGLMATLPGANGMGLHYLGWPRASRRTSCRLRLTS